MNCKFCNAEMEEESTLCPACGKDNAETEETCQVDDEVMVAGDVELEASEEAQAVEVPAEKPVPEPKERRKMTSGKLAVIYVAVLAVIAVLAVVVLMGLGEDGPDMNGGSQTSAVAATVPKDGNKDDVTCQGSYTVSDRKAKSKSGKTVATIADGKLTNAELQIYYWMQVYNYIENYSSGADVDFAQGLDTQIMSDSPDGWTWQQYMLDAALNNWHMYYAFGQEGKAASFEVEADLKEYLENLPASIESVATSNGFESADALIQHDMGSGATMEAYLDYMNSYYYGYAYYNSIYESTIPTEDQIAAYFEENAETFAEQGVTQDDSVYVHVRHILLQPETEDDQQACKERAEEILDEWLAGEKTAESFGELANAHSTDPGSNTTGGLYEYVYEGQMVEEFNDWCFDPARQPGDYGIVETSYGYHIMYFGDSVPVWYAHAESGAKNELLEKTIDELMAKYPADFKYNKMVLGNVDLSGS